MCRTIKNCFFECLTFDKLLAAHERASIGKKSKREVILFEMDLETNLIRIMDELKTLKYQFGGYRVFTIYEPKERVIKSLPYRDRIVHQWYVEEFIKPYFYKRFIKDTYACLDNKGSHLAAKNTQKYMRKMMKQYGSYYVLKCDVKKYFYTIDKGILKDILKRRIKDKTLLEFTNIVLDDGEDLGIPIGNFTSQYYANIYLDVLDHYVKEVLSIKYYVRYMDDFVFLVETKKEASLLLDKIRVFLRDELHLELNSKSRYFANKYGIDFCGYRIYETHIVLRKRFKKKVNKNVRMWRKLKREDKFIKEKMLLSWNSIKAHASHADSFNYISKQEQLIANEFEI